MVPRYGLTLVTPPAAEPITVQNVIDQARIPAQTNDSALIALYITRARIYFEKRTNRQCITTTYLYVTDAFPGRKIDEYRPPGWRYGIIRMPRAPLQSVTQIQYIDPGTGLLVTLDPSMYQVDTKGYPGRIAPARFQIWPVTDPLSFNAVQITFVAGYGNDGTSVPEDAKQAIVALATHLYENREVAIDVALQKIPYGLESYIRAQKIGDLA